MASAQKFKVSFSLDEEDAKYFRSRFRAAKRGAAGQNQESIVRAARALVESVRKARKTPNFVLDAITTLEDLTQVIDDEDYRAPKPIRTQVLAALAYFSNPDDIIPDDVPVLGFLDDAIMIKFVEDEFKHELAGYRKFRKFRQGAEQRPWTKVAGDRLPKRLDEQRAKVRKEIDAKKKQDDTKGRRRFLGL